MTTTRTVAAAAALLLLAGCGSGATTQGSQPAVSVGPCTSTEASVRDARELVRADVDGDGDEEAVRLTGTDAACPDVLFVRSGDGYLGVRVAGDLPVRSASAIHLEGRRAALVVVRQEHPRGGLQLRVYAAASPHLSELTHDAQPLVPFIATDTEQPVSADCERSRIVVTEAVAHEPPGILAAWDVRRTAYDVQGAGARASTPQEIADNVLPDQLGKRFPDLVRHTMFASCGG